MKIQIIDFGVQDKPLRAHYNDAGADVYAMQDYLIGPNQTLKIPLGFGLKIPDGFAGFIFPRSGLSSKGIVCELPPIDSGYRGEIHAMVTNCGSDEYAIRKGDRIGQLVILPIVLCDFEYELENDRGTGAFASTGR